MSIYEYNEEYVRKSLFEDGKETGYSQGKIDGISAGKTAGENKLGKLITRLLADGKVDEVRLVSEDEAARKEFYEQYHISD